METIVVSMKSDLVIVKSGLRQGDPISHVLFNLVLEKVIRETRIQPNEGIKLQDKAICLLVHADDVVLGSLKMG